MIAYQGPDSLGKACFSLSAAIYCYRVVELIFLPCKKLFYTLRD